MSRRQHNSRSEDGSLCTDESNNTAPASTKRITPAPARKRPVLPCTTTSTGSPIEGTPSRSSRFAGSPAQLHGYSRAHGAGYDPSERNLDFSYSGSPPNSHTGSLGNSSVTRDGDQHGRRPSSSRTQYSYSHSAPNTYNRGLPGNKMDLVRQRAGYSQNASNLTGASFNSESVLPNMLVQSGGLHAMHLSQANTGQVSGNQASTNITRGFPHVLQPSQSLPAQETPRGYQPIGPRPVSSGHNALPMLSSALDQLHFKSKDQAQEYLNRPIHYIIPGLWAVPQTDAAMALYVEKLVKAIANIEDIWDGEECPWSLLKFQPGGECTNPIYVESIAWALVSDTMKIHRDGIIGPQFSHASHFKVEDTTDLEVTFPQRIDLLAKLLYHSKMAASEVMIRQYVDKYIAMPFAHLMQFPQFVNIWTAIPENERIRRHEILPYPRYSRHFTMAEGMRLLADYQEKQRLFPPTSSQNPGSDNSGDPSSSDGLGQPANSPPNDPDTRTASNFGGPLDHGSPDMGFLAIQPSDIFSSPWGTDAERLFGFEGMGSFSRAPGSAPDGGVIQSSVGERYAGGTVQRSNEIAFGIAGAALPGYRHIAAKSDSGAQQEVSSEVGSANVAEMDHSRTN
ncbi:predicted protein [Plenodomus lingam JN3]|uniref:Predicted protein n=1 Tax=Leptosphaeria maculans (strain JN3 / isolate v23.1.3 / race Av1-4-5-6-7-8) TaxID=985895 RepID=E4ZJ44_LEPMJ|nr:predicted protein [Plenodomus lingam JN3]CBX91475.1 predicted protein [Plenodomus lingam JN3]